MLWRLRGLRLRAHNTISVLAAASPVAYQLWIARNSGQCPSASAGERFSSTPIAYIVIADHADANGVTQTLRSIRTADPLAQIVLFDADGEDDFAPSPGVLRSTKAADFIALLSGHADHWLCPLLAGDRLADGAVHHYRFSIADERAKIYYCDDDLIDENGNRSDPYFKPDWNPELFEHQDYLSFSCLFRTGVENLAALSARLDGAAIIRGLVAAAARDKTAAPPVHIARILHHRRNRQLRPSSSTATQPKPLHSLSSDDSVTIIIPTKNGFDLLSNCIEGIENTRFKNKDVIIIDHQSDDPKTIALLENLSARGYQIVQWSGVFNYSAMNNHAVRFAKGKFLCFLNNDVEMKNGDWLSLLLKQARRPEVGAVGAKLLYPDNTIQHAGVVIGVGGAAGHAHRYCPNDDSGYFDRPHLPQFVTAVTAACMVVERGKFDTVEGFDEVKFPVAFNDVDFCLKLVRAGWQNFYEPRAVLIHHESKTRGSDRLRKNRQRFAGELQALKDIWKTDRIRDPYHNPNLSRLTEQFLIDI